MLRPVLKLTFASLIVLSLLCGAGLVRAWFGQGQELVMQGAMNVQFDRRGASRLHITYRLPPEQSLDDLRRFLLQQGWRKPRLPNMDRETLMTFVRPVWANQIREILIITIDPRNRRQVDLQFGRCVTINTWVNCL
jgi:hypothetical protein